MADLSRSTGRLLGVLGLTGLLLGLGTACSSDDADPEPRPAAVCGKGTEHGCFDLSAYGNLYCTVLQTREGIAQGKVRVEDLPEWADREPVGDAVRVFDFRNPPSGDLTGAQYTQELLNAVHEQGVLLDANDLQERRDCGRDLSQRTVAASEGGWPAR